MKNKQLLCMRYWLTLAGKSIFFDLAAVLISFDVSVVGVAGIYLIANRSLTFFPQENHRLMVLTSPFDRKTIWRTHFLMQTILLGLLTIPLLLRYHGTTAYLLICGLSLLCAHCCCAVTPRIPTLEWVSAVPLGVFLLLDLFEKNNENLRIMLEVLYHSTAFIAIITIAAVLLFVLDIFAWRKMEQRFLSGGTLW